MRNNFSLNGVAHIIFGFETTCNESLAYIKNLGLNN